MSMLPIMRKEWICVQCVLCMLSRTTGEESKMLEFIKSKRRGMERCTIINNFWLSFAS